MSSTEKTMRVLAICDSDALKKVYSQDNAIVTFQMTYIAGVQQLTPAHILGILDGGSTVLLKLSDFDGVAMVINHLRGPIHYRAIEDHLETHNVPCASMGVPDGRSSYGASNSTTYP